MRHISISTFLGLLLCSSIEAAPKPKPSPSPKLKKAAPVAAPAVAAPVVAQPKPALLAPKPDRKWWYFNYFAEFTGPSADFHIPLESFSTAVNFYAPMALYQNINAAYVFETTARLGIDIGHNTPLQDNIVDRFYNFYSSKASFFDPTVYYQYYNFLRNNFSWVNGKVSYQFPMTEYSKNVGYWGGLYNGYIWNFRVPSPKHYFALNFDFYLYFWEYNAGNTRFATSTGFNYGYFLSNAWSIDATTYFDFSLISKGNANYEFNEGSVDSIKLILRYQPVINVVQLGLFLQAPLYYRRLDRMALGLNFNLWL